MKRILLSALVLTLFIVTAPAQQNFKTVTSSQASMTYHLVHPLHKIEATSNNVQYKVEMDPTSHAIKSVSGTVDVTTFSSGNSNRDSHAMEVIDALDYPDASFTSDSVVAKGSSGDSLWVKGKMTFHGVTKDVLIPVGTKWSQNRLDVNGSFDVTLTEFNIERPSLLMIPVEDNLSFDFSAAFNF
ncbi:MAG TPA: YceI family protein [Candidatus Kapabacteria bacterium]|nr:YceI family protein [Candidatus Kapabacteria bacterium]